MGDLMRTVRVLRRATVIAALSGTLVFGGFATMAGAKTAPKLVVTPSVGLTNNKSVVVKGTGFKAHDQVYITECLRTAKGAAQCNIATAIPVNISAKGVLPATRFKVIVGLIGPSKCGTVASNLKSCAISVGNISGLDTASAPIVFTAPKG
jgi:hypothetical protein